MTLLQTTKCPRPVRSHRRATLARALQRLEAATILERRDGRYRDLQALTIDMAARAAELQRLQAHWTRVCLERPEPRGWLATNVISVSASDLERIREVLRMVFREIRALAAASTPVESVALLNLQRLTWPDE